MKRVTKAREARGSRSSSEVPRTSRNHSGRPPSPERMVHLHFVEFVRIDETLIGSRFENQPRRTTSRAMTSSLSGSAHSTTKMLGMRRRVGRLWPTHSPGKVARVLIRRRAFSGFPGSRHGDGAGLPPGSVVNGCQVHNLPHNSQCRPLKDDTVSDCFA